MCIWMSICVFILYFLKKKCICLNDYNCAVIYAYTGYLISYKI